MLKAFATGATLLASLAATAVTSSPASAASPTGTASKTVTVSPAGTASKTVTVSPAVTASPNDEMVIGVVAANGSGCPWGSAVVTPSPDGKAFTVTYSQFTAQVGVGTQPSDFRKNCQLALDVHVPQGYTYAISGTDYRGYMHLEQGANGSETANYYFQGEAQSTKIPHYFTGPVDGDWQRTDSVGISSLAYLPCGEQRYLNVNTELRVNGGSSNLKKTTSMITMDSTDGRIDTVYHVAWKKC